MEGIKERLGKRFTEVFGEDSTLFCVQLDGFSHLVYWKDAQGNKHVDMYSGCAPEQYSSQVQHEDGIYREYNCKKQKEFFKDVGHSCYQCNPKEIIYKDRKEW